MGSYTSTLCCVTDGKNVTVPVLKPIRAFSPPSNPAVHHSLIGPIRDVAMPPEKKRK